MDVVAIEIGIVLGIILLLAAGTEMGFRFGVAAQIQAVRRGRGQPPAMQIGAIQGAVLGLLGLLLGFSFAGASGRFAERQGMIVREANALGTAQLRAELLDEPHRGALEGELRRYIGLRVSLLELRSSEERRPVAAEMERSQRVMWDMAKAGVAAKPSLLMGVLPPLNEVFDLHTSQRAATRRHLPVPVMALLIGSAMLALATVGYGNGMTGRRQVGLMVAVGLLIASSLWTTIDLDFPAKGVIRVDGTPLRELEKVDGK